MGFYIQGPNNLKADYLIQNHQAKVVSQTDAKMLVEKDEEAVVCVVENGPFDAAGLAFNLRELEAFTLDSDPREKTFLVMNKEKAHELAGYKV